MPSKKENKLPWYGYAKYCIIPAIVVVWINFNHRKEGDWLGGKKTDFLIQENKPSKETEKTSTDELLEETINKIRSGDLETRARIIHNAHVDAKEGDIKAEALLGRLHLLGEGVAKNIDLAVQYSKKAALKGNPFAANTLYIIFSNYDDSHPAFENKPEAAKWLQLAADSGDPCSQGFLGTDCLYGVNGQSKDLPKAFFYINKSAQNGVLDSIYWLGECYANGWGVRQDANSAIRCLTQAADSTEYFAFHAIAQRKLADAYQYGYGVTKNAKKAFEYYLKSGLQGDDLSQMELARAYANGRGVVPSEAMALVWIYVNRASGGQITDKAVSAYESQFSRDDLLAIQQKARDISSGIEQNRVSRSATKNPLPKNNRLSGSGVIISSAGMIITAAHVVKDSKNIDVYLSNGIRSGKVVELDLKNDLAILRITGSGYSAAPLLPSRDVKLGQSVFTIGFPNTDIQGSSPKLTKGEISSLSGMQDEPTQWQISVPVQSGNSGSPLFDEAGNVVGVVVSKLNALETAKTTGDLAQNVNYAVKNAYLVPMLEKFQDKLPPPRKRGLFQSFESVVEDSKKSVVLILAY